MKYLENRPYIYIKVIPSGNPKTYSAAIRNKRWIDFPFSLKSVGNKKSIIDSQTYLDFLSSFFFKLFWSFIKYILKNSISFCRNEDGNEKKANSNGTARRTKRALGCKNHFHLLGDFAAYRILFLPGTNANIVET